MAELVIILILAVVGAVMVAAAKRRRITDLSSQEGDVAAPTRDRPAGPSAETMDPDQTGGHRSAN